ncbi:PQQ-binding-like beta-propeller repeat protein [Nocardiopsis tropica]|uniref:PQQ-binding-like beta-propeller repeat protein n=1 Tax=Nocardiopsis tropica TaxID=109330 RepID=A0ABV1ZT48_9ACTN
MRSSRVPQALTCGLAALLAAGCTGDPEPPAPSPEAEPAPLPTSFAGEAPPGVEGEVLRYLHGDSAQAHDILDDPLGVRISPVGESFLISSGGEDRHLLHDAATGDTLWEGEARFRGFDSAADGARVLSMAGADGVPFVLDSRGESVWEPQEEGDAYLDGLAVRRPEGWSAEEPHGEFTLLDADGGELWSYEFAEPEESEEPEEPEESAEGGDGADGDGGAGEPVLGVPVAARGDMVVLASGGPSLQARSVAADTAGEELWTVDGEDAGLDSSGPVLPPQVMGVYPLPGPEEGGGADPADGGADEAGDEEAGEGDGADEAVVLLRWAQPEAPSTLSAHDPATGDLLWTLEEPGANPTAGAFDPAGTVGNLYDASTGVLLLPQASGEATTVAVDLAGGEVLWGLEEEAGSISPAFAFDGLVYGDSRGSTGADEQLVLDAVTMDVVGDDLSAYVEAVTEDGYAILVHDRQRFVYGPPPEEGPSEAPADDPERGGDPSGSPGDGG